MKPRTFFVTVAQYGLAGAVLLLSHYHYSWLAAILVVLPSVYNWLMKGRNQGAALAAVPSALIGLSVVVMVGLDRPPFGQAVFPVFSRWLLHCCMQVGWCGPASCVYGVRSRW